VVGAVDEETPSACVREEVEALGGSLLGAKEAIGTLFGAGLGANP